MGGNIVQNLIGNSQSDTVAVPHVFGLDTIMGHLNTAYYHVHGRAFVWPDAADAIELTAGAGAWNATGAKTEVVPAGATGLNVADFDLHWINIADLSNNGEYQVNIYSGAALAEVLIGSARTQRNAIFTREGPQAIQIPQQPKGTRISCQLLDSTAGALTCKVSFSGHYYAS
jgi:hypothetical protein